MNDLAEFVKPRIFSYNSIRDHFDVRRLSSNRLEANQQKQQTIIFINDTKGDGLHCHWRLM